MIHDLETMVRSGQFAEAQKLLATVRLRQLSRADALRVANIARRVHNFRLALAILNPVIRSEVANTDPTPQEKIEYAESLRKLGAINEAQAMLREIDPEQFPEALLIRAFCHFSKWQYLEAIPLLKKCASSVNLESYRLRVAQLNLAAAYVFLEESADANLLLKKLLEDTLISQQDLLHGNALELSAQLALQNDQPNEAIRLLDRAREILQHVSGADLLFVEKWQAVAQLRLNELATESLLEALNPHEKTRLDPSPTTQLTNEILMQQMALNQLNHVRERAVTAGHWETVRDCDFHLSQATGDNELFKQIYFGTPFASFRIKILSREKCLPPTELHFVHRGGSELGKQRLTLDVESGTLLNQNSEKEAQLPEGQLLHRLLIALSRDTYRPMPMLEVFGSLFNDEFYNPKSSPNRVHQAIKKFRQWLKDSGADLELTERDGCYSLTPGPTTGIKVPREPLSLDQEQILNQRVQRVLLERNTITARELALHLGVSLASSKRLLLRTARSGLIELIGAGPSAHYRKTAA